MEQPNRKGVQRVRHELRIRDVTVSRIEPLGDSFLSITFQGEKLDGFVSASFDDHVKFMFELGGEQLRRDYTPLWYDADARELTLEFALHEGGGASDWAKSASVGQHAVIGGPRGSMIIPLEYDWYLLAGDRSALPAIRRRLVELPAGARVIVVAAASGADRLPMATQAQLELTWVEDDEGLIGALRSLTLPSGDGFAWFAGEAATAKRVRSLLAEEKGIGKHAVRVSAYWKQGVSGHHENLE